MDAAENKRVRNASLPSLTVLQAKLNGFSGFLSVLWHRSPFLLPQRLPSPEGVARSAG